MQSGCGWGDCHTIARALYMSVAFIIAWEFPAIERSMLVFIALQLHESLIVGLQLWPRCATYAYEGVFSIVLISGFIFTSPYLCELSSRINMRNITLALAVES